MSEPTEDQAEPPAGGTQLNGQLMSSSAAQFPEVNSVEDEETPVLSQASTPSTATAAASAPNEAQDMPKRVSGKVDDQGAKETMDVLYKAYNHAQLCGNCNERLGEFVENIVHKLGVRMPRIRQVEEICESGVGASQLKTRGIGPGTVEWDPKARHTSFKVEPTPSALLLAAEELKEKCRLKDAMIETLAEELAVLERRGLWNSHETLAKLMDRPNPSPIDFNRQTLCKFLNNEPLDGFDDADEGEERFATNPLGLTVVRQVGPDGLLVKWLPVPNPDVTCYEVFVNGLLMQRILSPGRSKALLHPLDLTRNLKLTLSAVSYNGEPQDSASAYFKA